MKVVLVFPPYAREKVYPPLGIAYLASSLEKEGHKVDIIDASILNLSYQDVLNRLKHLDPDAIGITTLTPYFHHVRALSYRIKQEFLNVPLIYGGPHATAFPKETLEETPADIVVIGEGEATVVELAEAIERDRPLNEVKGLGYKEERNIIFTGKRELIENIDDVPFPARHLLPIREYKGDSFVKQRPYTTVISSRGCPFNCVFCASRTVWGRTFRQRSVKNVIGELRELADTKIREIIWHDDNFALSKQWATDLCQEIVQEKLDLTWKCLVRVDQVDNQLLKWMKLAGCHTLWFGVESGNQEILNKNRKNITLQQVENAVKLARAHRLEANCFFMIGNYGESYETMMDTLRFAKKLNPDYAVIAVAAPWPGTDLLTLARNEGLIEREDWDSLCTLNEAIIRTKDLTSRDLVELQDAMSTVFYGDWTYLKENLISRLGTYYWLGYADLRRIHYKSKRFLLSMLKLRSARTTIAKIGLRSGI